MGILFGIIEFVGAVVVGAVDTVVGSTPGHPTTCSSNDQES